MCGLDWMWYGCIWILIIDGWMSYKMVGCSIKWLDMFKYMKTVIFR